MIVWKIALELMILSLILLEFRTNIAGSSGKLQASHRKGVSPKPSWLKLAIFTTW